VADRNTHRPPAASSLKGLIAALVLLVPAAARAGEVRVNISSNQFTPRAVNCNAGDHVVWIWTGGSHNTVSGDSATSTGDGTWNSGTVLASQTFTWQATGSGTFRYFCAAHAPDMAGRVIVSSGVAVSDLRLTEVQYNEPSGHDLIEITNLGTVAGDLGKYRLSVANNVAVTLAALNIAVAPGATITIHTNEAGTNTATDVFLGALGALNDAAGSVALFAPNTRVPDLADETQLIDFVEWGSTGEPNEAVGVSSGMWSSGDSAPVVASGHSIEFCLDAAIRPGSGRWFDNPTPNFGGAADDCSTPVRGTSWGRIKTLYR
jgi:plastocyanin